MSKKQNKIYLTKSNIKFIILLLVGALSLSLTMVKSGWIYKYGMGFWGPNGHDGIWHIAIIESLARGSWNMPIFSGSLLSNYHIGFDLIVAAIHKLTFIPVVNLYFQFIPVILALGIGISSYWLVLTWTKSKASALWATFFIYFGGSWGWLVGLLRNGKVGGESMFWAQQSVSTLINPPFALSLVVMFCGLALLIKGIRTNNKKYLIPSSILLGVLIQIKVYAGLIVLASLFVTGIYQMIIKRQGITLIKVFTSVLVLSLLLFLPFESSAAASVHWKPFWFLETMMQISDRLNWVKFGNAMVNYRLGNIWWKAIPAYLVALIIFWYGNMGTRIIGEFYWLKKSISRQIDWIDVFIVTAIVAGGIVPTFFVQTGTPWNTIQFFYYSLVFSGILAGIVLSDWIGKFSNKAFSNKRKLYKAKGIVIALVVVIVTLPTTYSTLMYNYIPSRPPAKLPNDEIAALSFLANQDEGVVLTYPYDPKLARAAESNPPRPLYLYESTAYVSAFSKHDVYLEDEVNLNITGYDWVGRREKSATFILENDSERARSFLTKNDIKYIYWLKNQRALLGETQLVIEMIYENDSVDIYKVAK